MIAGVKGFKVSEKDTNTTKKRKRSTHLNEQEK
jgi:hypothetical protein